MVVFSAPSPCSAETTNTRAAHVSATAIAISRTERRARSAKGPDCNLRGIIMGPICAAEICIARVLNVARHLRTDVGTHH